MHELREDLLNILFPAFIKLLIRRIKVRHRLECLHCSRKVFDFAACLIAIRIP